MCETAASDNAKIQTDFEAALCRSQTITNDAHHQQQLNTAADGLNRTVSNLNISTISKKQLSTMRKKEH